MNLILFFKELLVVVGKNNCSVGYMFQNQVETCRVFLSFDSNSFVLVGFLNLLLFNLSVTLCVNSGMIVAITLARISLDPEIIDATISFPSVFLAIVFSISVMSLGFSLRSFVVLKLGRLWEVAVCATFLWFLRQFCQIEFLINAGTDKG